MHGGDHHHHCQHNNNNNNKFLLNLSNLKIVSALGRGAKGVVFLVQTEENGQLLALKAILRSSIDKKKLAAKADAAATATASGHDDNDQYRRIYFERDVLASFNHPLLPKLHGVLVTDTIVGYAIDYCPGRDLNSLRKRQTEKMFSDDIIRFYAAELVLGLEYLHGLGIVYRDLKPENVMIQENGHLMLVDFDLSTKLSAKSPQSSPIVSQSKPQINPRKKKRFGLFFKRRDSGISPEYSVQIGVNSTGSESESDSVEKSNSFVGTEEYVSPEIILGNGHDFSVDWWCLGVMLYEMLYGMTPFRGANRKETFYKIISKPPNLTGESTALRDLIGKLLEKDPKKRITVGEIKGHEFFNAVDWDSIMEIPRPPFIPEVEDMEGNKQIDLESYVQGVFTATDEGKIENNKISGEENNNNNKNRDVWVNHPTQIQRDNFLIF